MNDEAGVVRGFSDHAGFAGDAGRARGIWHVGEGLPAPSNHHGVMVPSLVSPACAEETSEAGLGPRVVT